MNIGDNFDPETALQVQKLQQEKDKAVRDENFDLAKELKDTITRLVTIGNQLTSLERSKKMAIENEDFD
jgi:centrosomal protein CEP104